MFGPLGEERQDRRVAWLAWWVAKASCGTKATPQDFLQDFLQMLHEEQEEIRPDELIIDDPDASTRKAKEIEATLLRKFPKGKT